jgi:hypothetical protein
MRGKENVTEGSVANYISLASYSNVAGWALYDERLLTEIFKKKSFQYNLLRFISDWVIQITFNHQSMMDFCRELKSKRDSIAHGEEAYVEDIPDCLHWHKQTINFIDGLKEAILISAEKASLS